MLLPSARKRSRSCDDENKYRHASSTERWDSILAGMSLPEMLEAMDQLITKHADRDERMRANVAATRAQRRPLFEHRFAMTTRTALAR